ncbi:probable phosphatidylethanolamine N-methyltransferase [hydrothermal vent metagenome]|uniref:Probable phosphatidylethanolamine N-methyltransferase n=1 Tax=hydrothermal vent metagenome TaxID=652676 RepID=A0A3B1BES1_9ZZZZ
MSLKHSYTFLAPIYDYLVEPAFTEQRRKNLACLKQAENEEILLIGIGTGLDIPWLPSGPRYTGIDLTPAMLARAKKQMAERRDIELKLGDAMQLPFDDVCFDTIIMHLILAVVPDSLRALQEAQRVLRPGGRILILDKFIRPGQLALSRRLLSIFLRHIATRTDVVFEPLLAQCPQLTLMRDEPALAKGWFRYIELHKDKKRENT